MRVVALSGGVGGARLLHGLCKHLDASQLTIVVNTGCDFDHPRHRWGLRICPGLDTVLYTLSDLGDQQRGWGLADESFAALAMMKRYGGEDWFALGDRDLATHLLRTQWLREGRALSKVTAELFSRLGVQARVLPMSDAPCPTCVATGAGELPFNDWFVRHRCGPRVDEVRFDREAAAAPGLLRALDECDAVVFGPSNPYVPVEPMLARPGVLERVLRLPAVAVSRHRRWRLGEGTTAGHVAEH